MRPVRNDEQVDVRDREGLSREERLLRERLREGREAIAESLHRALANVSRRLRIPERPEALVYLGGDEAEPLHELPALGRTELRRERAGLLVRDVLQQHVRFGHARAIVELEHGHVATR